MNDRLKQRLMMALIGFNLTVIVCQIGFTLFGGRRFAGEIFGMRMLISLGVGLVVAAVAYFATQMTQR